MDEYRAHLLAPTSTITAGVLTVTWTGVTGLLVSDGAHALLIDPFFTRPEGVVPFLRNAPIAPDEQKIAAALARLHVQKLDAVLVSHSHFDHAMDAGVVARLTGAELAGSQSTANIGRGASLPESQLRVMQPLNPARYGDFVVTFIESRHAGATGGRPTGDITAPLTSPARYLDYRQGGSYSILVQHPRGALLHHGSAGFVHGALASVHADVVFLGVALIDDLDVYIHEVVDATGARRIVPVHWDDFTRGLDQPLVPFPLLVRLKDFFARMRQRPDLTVQTLDAFQPAVLF
jgi:L-ascorbate metabolism protein UlaG (beta-lactamase superfamily)